MRCRFHSPFHRDLAGNGARRSIIFHRGRTPPVFFHSTLSLSHLSDRAASRATVIQREPFSRVNSIKNEPTSIVRFTAPHGYGNAIHRSVAVTPISDGLQWNRWHNCGSIAVSCRVKRFDVTYYRLVCRLLSFAPRLTRYVPLSIQFSIRTASMDLYIYIYIWLREWLEGINSRRQRCIRIRKIFPVYKSSLNERKISLHFDLFISVRCFISTYFFLFFSFLFVSRNVRVTLEFLSAEEIAWSICV